MLIFDIVYAKIKLYAKQKITYKPHGGGGLIENQKFSYYF